MGTRWSDVLTFNIQFIKSPCTTGSQQNMFFTEDEVNDINTWLTSPDYPILFHMYDYDFERDSSDSMVLIDGENISHVEITADGYYTSNYGIEDDPNSPWASADYSGIEYDDYGNRIEKKNPPDILDVHKYGKYYSLVSNNNEYIQSISSITVDGTEYQNVNTNSWLSTYEAQKRMNNSYTVLVNTEKILNNKYDYFGVFSDVQPQVIDGNVVGFTCTFSTDSPFAWTHEITQTVDGSATFLVNSAEKYRQIYPLIVITPEVDGEYATSATRTKVVISNNIDGLNMELNVSQGSNTTIDSQRSIIKDQTGLVSFTDLGIDDADYIYWPRLYNGDNTITVTGGTATIKYREPRKVGDY